MGLRSQPLSHETAGRGCDFSWLGDFRRHAIVCAAQGNSREIPLASARSGDDGDTSTQRSADQPPTPFRRLAGGGGRCMMPAVQTGTTWLVGDVGATNARFGLASPDGAILHSRIFACDDFAEIGAAIEAYLGGRGNLPMPRRGALAIAAPIIGDQVRMTNH